MCTFGLSGCRVKPKRKTCTFEGPGLQSHHQNSTKRSPREEERMKMVAGEGKRAKYWAEGVRLRVSPVRWSGGGGVGGSAQILDTPTKILNTHRTDTPHHTTQQQRLPHRVVLGLFFLVSRMVRKGLGTKRIKKSCLGQEAVWARSGAGQKWSEKPQNMETKQN